MSSQGVQRLERQAIPRPKPRVLDISTTLRHFALITYAVKPERLRAHVDERFPLVTASTPEGTRAFLSVVVFENTNFGAAAFPSPRLRMPQINYRVYVTDPRTGDPAIWFLGTFLGSWVFIVPRRAWQMPWRRASIHIHATFNKETGLYEEYEGECVGPRAPCRVRLRQTGEETVTLPGFPDTETGLTYLTHAFSGFYRRPDGRIGVNRVWHEVIDGKAATVEEARFDLLDRWNLVPVREQHRPYSVLVTPRVDFVSRVPPRLW